MRVLLSLWLVSDMIAQQSIQDYNQLWQFLLLFNELMFLLLFERKFLCGMTHVAIFSLLLFINNRNWNWR